MQFLRFYVFACFLPVTFFITLISTIFNKLKISIKFCLFITIMIFNNFGVSYYHFFQTFFKFEYCGGAPCVPTVFPASTVTWPIIPHTCCTYVQGGSDKSGILKTVLQNHTAQLKIIRFYWTKKRLPEEHIKNQVIQWNSCQRRGQPQSWTLTSSRPSPRCPCIWTPSPPSSFGCGPRFCGEALHWPITQRRPTQNSPKGCS